MRAMQVREFGGPEVLVPVALPEDPPDRGAHMMATALAGEPTPPVTASGTLTNRNS